MDHPIRLGRGLFADLDPTGLSPWESSRRLSLARCSAAVLRVPSARCLSHEAAALVHGLAVARAEPDISLILPTWPSRSSVPLPTAPGGGPQVQLRRRTLRISAEDITVVDGLPVTTVLRTAVDCAFDLPAQEAICVVDAALRRICQPDRRRPDEAARLTQVLRHRLTTMIAACGRRRGARRARAVASIASPLSESPGESVLRCFVAALGLPTPQLQHGIVLEEGRTVFPDLAWPEVLVSLEFDGRLKYTSPEALWREKQRRDALNRLGWRCEHVTWGDLQDLGSLRSRIFRLFPPQVLRAAHPEPLLWS
ncbi:hypothetical protein ID810_11990 [Actinomyces respiraculi]|uniref:DUF559 domain-containing protein n=2 Tax=Actinomycetaceae TaxID=2049 RepID=A0A7T0PYJ7_9ACTO|nr:hypothetical protein ID810_11990 [Actinomyces respiraculi]